jgi:hypothetical protein
VFTVIGGFFFVSFVMFLVFFYKFYSLLYYYIISTFHCTIYEECLHVVILVLTKYFYLNSGNFRPVGVEIGAHSRVVG